MQRLFPLVPVTSLKEEGITGSKGIEEEGQIPEKRAERDKQKCTITVSKFTRKVQTTSNNVAPISPMAFLNVCKERQRYVAQLHSVLGSCTRYAEMKKLCPEDQSYTLELNQPGGDSLKPTSVGLVSQALLPASFYAMNIGVQLELSLMETVRPAQ